MAAVGSVEQGLERQADAARVEGELAQMGTEGAMGAYRTQEYGSPGGVISLETLNGNSVAIVPVITGIGNWNHIAAVIVTAA